MTQEDKDLLLKDLCAREQKDLLLKDLCARLPYGVKLQNINDVESIGKLRSIDLDDYCCEILFYTYQGKALTICDRSKLFRFGTILRYKPCLFPLSSMTEEQEKELKKVYSDEADLIAEHLKSDISGNIHTHRFNHQLSLNWYLKNHFDINGLIPMGLAIDATNLNIY